MKKLVTISDVAKLSGISVSTISRVINNKPHVSEAKRQKVLAAMEQLGYQPLQAARQMRGSGSNNIAVVVPNITNAFFAYLVNAIERTCVKNGYKTLITQTYGDKRNEEEALSLLSLHHVDGMILCAIENDWSLVKSYMDYGKLVVCNEYNDDNSVSMVCAKQYEGFLAASKYLLSKGYRRIAYCTGGPYITLQPVGININSDRYRGYSEALSEAGIASNPNWLFHEIRTMEDGGKLMGNILELSERPDAVIAGSDAVAAGMIMEGIRRGIRIPEDIAVLGVDNQPIAKYLQIPITTICQPVSDMGKLAAAEMVTQLQEDSYTPARHELELELIIRQSA